jgi:hypothetical protein
MALQPLDLSDVNGGGTEYRVRNPEVKLGGLDGALATPEACRAHAQLDTDHMQTLRAKVDCTSSFTSPRRGAS